MTSTTTPPPPPQGATPVATPYEPYGPQLPEMPRPAISRLSAGFVMAVAAAAVLGNLALRTQVSTLAGLLATLGAVGLLTAGRELNAWQKTFASLAGIFAVLLPLRASTWLASLNSLAACAALGALALAAQPTGIRFSINSIGALIARSFSALFALPILGRSLRPTQSGNLDRLAPVIRGVAIAAIPLLVLGSLLASADAVFANAITPDFDPTSSISHAMLSILVACILVGLLAISHTANSTGTTDSRPLGNIEALVLLGTTAVLYGAFAVVQLLSALGRSDDLLAEQGLSYAEYARGGFFQLLWVAALTVVLLGMVRLLVTEATSNLDRFVRGAGATVALLTCIIVVVAIVRLGLYTDEFGQTTLRWYCTAFAWMLGITFVLIAAAHLHQLERFLPSTLLSLTAVTLIVVNLANPEARVAEHNVSRSDAAASLDVAYLQRLSADAWPVLINNRELMISRNQAQNADRFERDCREADQPRGFGPLGFNLSLARLNCPS